MSRVSNGWTTGAAFVGSLKNDDNTTWHWYTWLNETCNKIR